MNNYCTYLNLPFPLFKESVDPFQLQKLGHFKLDKDEVLNNDLQNWFKLLKLEVFLVEVFYTRPNATGTVHIDSIGGDYTKLNWQFGGGNSVMNWYSINKPNKSNKPESGLTPIGSNYTRFEQHEVTKVHSQRIQNPSLIQVAVPHNIENFSEDRWVVSVVYKYPSAIYRRPTWTESLSIFNEYLIK
jgi:hypothetical protein